MTRFGAIAGTILGAIMVQSSAFAADLITKAPILETPLPAVDGINGKADAFGGALGHHSFYGSTGSFSAPLEAQFGFQADGLAASYRGNLLDGVGGHALLARSFQAD